MEGNFNEAPKQGELLVDVHWKIYQCTCTVAGLTVPPEFLQVAGGDRMRGKPFCCYDDIVQVILQKDTGNFS